MSLEIAWLATLRFEMRWRGMIEQTEHGWNPRSRRRGRQESTATRGGFVLRGLVAGAIGAWVMGRATWAMQDCERRDAIGRERAAWPEELDVSHLLGYRIAKTLGAPVSRDQPSTFGMVTHYLLSIGPAVLYAAMRERDLHFASDRGLLYGFAIFAVWDEVLSAAAGIAGPPQAYPWQAHLRGLVGHLSLGVATHVALTALETDFGVRPLNRHPGA
jgi:uncharacterized membrane protein YagU involved in acid resistance